MPLVSHPTKSILLLLVMFLVGTGFGIVGQEGAFFRTVWVKSYLRMHQSLVASPGETELVVMHSDLGQLKDLVARTPTMLGLTQSEFSNVAYVRIKQSHNGVYKKLRAAPYVRLVLQKRVVFFCH